MLGWLDYTPELDDFVYWGMFPDGVNHRVSVWPRPGSPRVDSRFRMLHGKDCQASAHRFLLKIKHELIVDPPTAATRDRWAIIDLLPVAGGHIEGTLPENPDGLVLRMSVQSFDELPESEVPGVRVEIEISLDDNGSVLYFEEYWTGIGETEWTPNAENWVSGGNVQGWIVDPLWTYGNFVQKYQSGADCYPFDRQSGFDPGFAEFNGIDSYIALSFPMNSWNQPFRVTCDFRYQGQPDWMPIFGKENAGGFFGMDDEDLIWGLIRAASSWNANVNDWHTWRHDFEQTGQLNYQMYIDGINVTDLVANRQNSNADRIGVYRHGAVGTIWGHFDLRNLKYLTGQTPNFTTVLDMPLLVNALDLGPQENHGTTFNMALPSV